MKSFLLGERPLNTDLAILFLRLLFGGLFIWHGWMKIDMYSTYQPMMTDIIGIGAKLSYDLLIFAEFGCGILVTLGFLTRLTVIPIAFSMSIAYFIAHKKDAFEMKEIVFLFLGLTLVIFILGSGKYSLDHLLFRNKFSKYGND
ncbi:MAG TPA: DoxX family protein [Chitinophagaceae bacterium]|jgi:putative oxidoreductase|nr:DoxX family protein [Chitinophagaceae bacterium]